MINGLIAAAGRGERMKQVCTTCSKPMIDFVGKPVLWYVYQELKKFCQQVVVVVSAYNQQEVENFFGSAVLYARQDKIDGTARAIYQGLQVIGTDSPVLFSWSDAVYWLPDCEFSQINEMFVFGVDVTEINRFDKVVIDGGDGVYIVNRASNNILAPFFGIAGVYYIYDIKSFFEYLEREINVEGDFEKRAESVISKMIFDGYKFRVRVLKNYLDLGISSEYLKIVGSLKC